MIDSMDVKSSGYDFGYSMMDGALNLSYSMNDDGRGSEMTHMGASYSVFENMTIHASMREYSGDDTDHVFSATNSAWTEGLSSGEIAHMDNGVEILSYGLTYDLGDISLSYTMHTASEDGYDDAELTDMSVSYKLNDNTSLGYRSYTLNTDVNANFITVQIGM